MAIDIRAWAGRFVGLGVAAGGALTALAAACSGDTDLGGGGTGGASTAAAAGNGGQGTGGDLFGGGQPDCPLGEPCEEHGICTENDVCCEAASACGIHCCAAAEICSFQQCVTPGADCVDASDCAVGEYCEYSLGESSGSGGTGGAGGNCQSGVVYQTGRCLPRPPECGPGEEPGDPPSCLESCEYVPPTTAFDPVVMYSWGGQTVSPWASDVMMTPIVVQLDDDNCDGKVNERDIPEIAFATFSSGYYYRPGTLHVISVVDGQVVDKGSVPAGVQASTGLAAGDLDADGVPEIVGCMAPTPGGTSCCDAQAQNTGVISYRANLTVHWTQPDTAKVHCGYESPAIADPYGNGQPLVLVGWTLLDGQTGNVVRELDPASSFGVTLTGFADVDGDGTLDVTDGQRAYRIDGTVIWDLRTGIDAISGGYHAVGDLDNDGQPEIAVVSSAGPHTMHLIRYDAQSASHVQVIRRGLDINNGYSTATFCSTTSEYGGGPPTIADFNGDGFPDVGAAGAVGYVVFDGLDLMTAAVADGDTILWFQTTQDCSSAVTGSSVFDFNGDGKAEVVYSDEVHLWMYDGTTGANLIPETCLTTGTLWEYPVIADVDNDGQADIVVASNAYALTCNGTKQSGILIFGSASGSWVRTRRIWNQHTYHVTNVNEDGSVPTSELANWLQPGLNNFRQNKQPGSEFAAPDLVVSVFPKCTGDYGLVARVRNVGEAAVPPGVVVGFYEGTPTAGTRLGEVATTQPLFALGSEDLLLPLVVVPADLVSARVDDGGPPHEWVECRTDNNDAELTDPDCELAN